MKKIWLFIVFFICWTQTILSYELKISDTIPNTSKLSIPTPAQLIDSLVLDEKLEWSVRLVSNFKEQRLRFSNDEAFIKYIPNNPFGVGFGIANQKLLIDIIFNIKGYENKDEQTNKFAAEGGFIIKKKNFFSFILENVHGYKISNSITNDVEFRKDISVLSAGLNYLRLFNKSPISVRSMKSGIYEYHKTTITAGVGGFFLVNRLSADNSIIPDYLSPYFNEQAEINKMNSFGFGVLGGFSGYISLPANFYASFHIAPGIGIESKKVYTETVSYKPSNPMLYKTDLFSSIGYVQKKFYINFSFATYLYATSYDFSNKSVLSVSKSKLAIGYNIGKINMPRKIF
jgi:hypothetical protein